MSNFRNHRATRRAARVVIRYLDVSGQSDAASRIGSYPRQRGCWGGLVREPGRRAASAESAASGDDDGVPEDHTWGRAVLELIGACRPFRHRSSAPKRFRILVGRHTDDLDWDLRQHVRCRRELAGDREPERKKRAVPCMACRGRQTSRPAGLTERAQIGCAGGLTVCWSEVT